MRQGLLFTVVFLLAVVTRVDAQQFPEKDYDRWFGSSYSTENMFITLSSQVTRQDTVYVYSYRLSNTGTDAIIVQSRILDRLLTGRFCFHHLIPLAPQETKEFVLTTHLKPAYSNGRIFLFEDKDMQEAETSNNEIFGYEELGYISYPQGSILNMRMGSSTNGVVPKIFTPCLEDRK